MAMQHRSRPPAERSSAATNSRNAMTVWSICTAAVQQRIACPVHWIEIQLHILCRDRTWVETCRRTGHAAQLHAASKQIIWGKVEMQQPSGQAARGLYFHGLYAPCTGRTDRTVQSTDLGVDTAGDSHAAELQAASRSTLWLINLE